MRVMGQPVRFAANAQIDTGLRIGEPVHVSGLRNASGVVVATRVARAAEQSDVSAIGTIDRGGALRGLPLTAARTIPGAELLVRGRWSGGAVEVAQTVDNPTIPFAGRVSRAVVEGLIHERDATRVTIEGFTIELGAVSSDEAGDLAKGRRIRVHGRFDAPRHIRADRIELVHSEFDERRGGDQSGRDSDDDSDDESRSRHRIDTDDDGNVRIRTETRNETEREKIEREFNAAGEIERERIDLRIEGPAGELERRERIDVRDSDGVIERRERIEIFENGRRVERIERTDRIESPDKPERPEKIERPDRSGKDD
jgi:hypothetical protein